MWIKKTVKIMDMRADEIANILSCLIDGSSYWCEYDYDCKQYDIAREELVKIVGGGNFTFEDVLARMIRYKNGGLLIMEYDGEEDEALELTYDNLIKGIELAVENNFWDGEDLADIDGWVGDAIMQYALLGQQVYA